MANTKHFMVLDSETVGLTKPFVFDVGYTITTRKEIKLERAFLVREILTDPRLMLGALFNDHWRAMFGGKLFRHYIPEIAEQNLRIFGWRDIVRQIREDMATYNVQVFSAYNLPFDSRALAKTQHHICEGGKILEYRPQLLCLWDFACGTVCNSQLYHDTARRLGEETGWITPAQNVRTTAEKVYAFLSGNFDFVESHTAIEDARIETEILHRLLAKKKPIPYDNPDIGSPWQRAQKIAGSLF
jgi:hypothetical protein